MMKKIDFFDLLVLLTMFVVPVLAFYGIGSKSVWFDEAYSVLIAKHSFKDIIQLVKVDSHPPLHFLLLSFWMKMFGMSEVAIRSLSGIFYIFTLITVYVLGSSLYSDRKTGFLCSFFYMISPELIYWAQTTRMYTILVFFGTLSTLFFCRLFLKKTNSKKDIIFYIIANICGTFTHYNFFFLLIAQIACKFILFPKFLTKKFIVAIFIGLIPFLVLWMPILLFQLNHNNNAVGWIAEQMSAFHLIKTFLCFYGHNKNIIAIFIYTLIVVTIIVRIEKFKIRFNSISSLGKFLNHEQNKVFIILLAFTLLVPFFISYVKPIYAPGKLALLGLLPVAMIIGSMMGKFANKTFSVAICLLLLIGVVAGLIKTTHKPHKMSDKIAAEFVMNHAENNDILMFTSISHNTFEYYMQLMEPDKTFIKMYYPLNMKAQPGFVDEERYLASDNRAEDEANSILDRIDNVVLKNKDTKVWMFYGLDTKVTSILKNKLDNNFPFKEVRNELWVSCYKSVIIYSNENIIIEPPW